MALIQCSECGHKVSSTAPSCPGCGHQLAAQQVQATAGATGKFLDPASNARSCLGVVALCFVIVVGFIVFRMIVR